MRFKMLFKIASNIRCLMRKNMFLLWQEMKETLFKNIKIFLMSVTAFALVCVMVGICLDNYIYASGEQAVMEESYAGKTFFKIIVNGEDDVLTSFFSSANVEKIKAFFDCVKDDSDFDYRYAHTNQIEFFNAEDSDFSEKDFPAYTESCVTGYESGEIYGGTDYLSLKGVWADRLFGTESTMVLSSGRWFKTEEFYVDDAENIGFPVILGHEYEGLYELGDTLEYAHLGTMDNITLTVVGFLEEGSCFYDNNNEKIILDRYMVVPEPETSDNFPYINEDGSYNNFFLSAYSSSKIMSCRIICKSEIAMQVQEKVNSIIQETGLYEIRISDETEGAALELVDAREITKHLKKYPNELSGGEAQRAAIARAVIHEPKVILADEPTGALDEATGLKIMRVFQKLHRQGNTIIIVTHDANIADMCGRTIHIRDGRNVTYEHYEIPRAAGPEM